MYTVKSSSGGGFSLSKSNLRCRFLKFEGHAAVIHPKKKENSEVKKRKVHVLRVPAKVNPNEGGMSGDDRMREDLFCVFKKKKKKKS
jgi:hypothetical protein